MLPTENIKVATGTDTGPGPSLADIGAARRGLHERQAATMYSKLPGTGQPQSDTHHVDDAAAQLNEHQGVGENLQQAQHRASDIKSQMAGDKGVQVPPQQALPGQAAGVSERSQGAEGAGGKGGLLSNVRAHSPVELPSTPAELPDSGDSSSSSRPTAIPHHLLSAPRVPSGVILCQQGARPGTAAGGTTGLSAAGAATSVPDSALQALQAGGTEPEEETDNALAAALAGSAGTEAGHEHMGHHTFQPVVSPNQHVPYTSSPPIVPHVRPADAAPRSGGGVLQRLMAPFIANAGSEDRSAPQIADKEHPSVYDSNQMMNMGPSSEPSDNRAHVGGVPMALGAFGDKVTGALHDAVEAGARMLGDTTSPDEPPSDLRPEDLPGMPGSMEVDQEVRALREEQAHARAEERAHAKEAAAAAHAADAERQTDQNDMREARDTAYNAEERTAEPHVGGSGGGGFLGKLVDKVSHALHLHPDSQEQPSSSGADTASRMQPQEYGEAMGKETAAERRAAAPVPLKGEGAEVSQRSPTHPGTAELERPIAGTPDEIAETRRAKGIPAGAQHAADARDDMTTKEGGQMGPAGATGQTRASPDAHVPAHAPDAANPNFFDEVGKRGLGDVIKHGAANVKDSVTSLKDRSGGEPAAWATTSGAVTDTKDIARNVERVEEAAHDPEQKRIYDAETYKVPAIHPKVTADRESGVEQAKEDTNIVLGKNKPISGAVPHDKPSVPQGSSGSSTGEGPKQAAASSMFDQIGTAKGRGPGSDSDDNVRTAVEPFLNNEEPTTGGQASSSTWSWLLYRLVPESKAVGGASAGTPTGTDRTQKPPVSDFGDDSAGRPHKAYYPDREQSAPTPGGISPDVAPHGEVKRAHTKDEPPVSKTSVPERIIAENIKSKIMGGPEEAGVPPKGADSPHNMYATIYSTSLQQGAKEVHDGLPDKLARVGESLGGAVQHVADKTSETVQQLPDTISGNREPRDSLQKEFAKVVGGGEEEAGSFDPYRHPGGSGSAGPEHGGTRVMDLKSGAEMSAHHKERILGALEDPDPARKRETFMDKVMYPFSKDAGKPDEAIAQARSYYEYVEEKKHQEEEKQKAEYAASHKPVGEQLAEGAEKAKEGAVQTAEAAREKASHWGPTEKLMEGAEHAAEKFKEGMQHAKETLSGHKPHSPEAGTEQHRQDSAGITRLQDTDTRFKDREWNEDAPGKHGPRVDDQGRPYTQTGSGMRHATGDVVTETVSNLGQAVIDTGRRLSARVSVGAKDLEDTVKSEHDARRPAGDVARDNAHDAADTARKDARAAADTARDNAHDAADTVRDSAKDVRDAAKSDMRDTGDAVRDDAKRAADSVRENVSDAARKTQDSLKDAADTARGAVKGAADSAREGTAGERHRDVSRDVHHDREGTPTNILDRAALGVGTAIETALGVFGLAPKGDTTGAREPGRGDKHEDVFEHIIRAPQRVQRETQSDLGGEPGSPSPAAGGTTAADRTRTRDGESLGDQVKDTVRAGVESGKETLRQMRERVAMEPAGDTGGYGRGATEEHEDRASHVIPEMPYISTDELMKQRATGEAQ